MMMDNKTVNELTSVLYGMISKYNFDDDEGIALVTATKALEAQPSENCISKEQALLALTGIDLPTDRDKLIALFTERIQHLPPVTPQIEPCEDCVSIEEAKQFLYERIDRLNDDELYDIFSRIIDDMVNHNLSPVIPKYTDEEINKAQAVEQAYVDKMVELAVEETKERYSDAIGKMKKAIDEMTEIHSDGEFYIKNVDAKWIIDKYLCDAEMSGDDFFEKNKDKLDKIEFL